MTIPRRISVYLASVGEAAIREAMRVVEGMGADVRLTQAVTLLDEAKEKVADFVDGVPVAPMHYRSGARAFTMPGDSAPSPQPAGAGPDWPLCDPSCEHCELWRQEAASIGLTKDAIRAVASRPSPAPAVEEAREFRCAECRSPVNEPGLCGECACE